MSLTDVDDQLERGKKDIFLVAEMFVIVPEAGDYFEANLVARRPASLSNRLKIGCLPLTIKLATFSLLHAYQKRRQLVR